MAVTLTGESVAPANLMLLSRFSQIDIALKGKAITSQTSNLHLWYLVVTLQDCKQPTKESQLTADLFYRDFASDMDDINIGDSEQTLDLKEWRTLRAAALWT